MNADASCLVAKSVHYSIWTVHRVIGMLITGLRPALHLCAAEFHGSAYHEVRNAVYLTVRPSDHRQEVRSQAGQVG